MPLTLRFRPAVAALAALLTLPAHADNSGNPMTFVWGVIHGDTPAVFADGDVTEDTPRALRSFLRRGQNTPDTRIFLNSLGGDLNAGMELGRIIREAHLNTGVARNSRDPDDRAGIDVHAASGIYPGYCVSACALAFLGGVSRQVEPGATYAVHQVKLDCVDKRTSRSRYPWVLLPTVAYCPELEEALSMVQVASGAVVEYVRSMGADPIFLAEMSKAGPQAINALTEEQLASYRINFTIRKEAWSFEPDAQGQFLLRYVLGDEWKEDKAELRCDRESDPRLLLDLEHDTRRSTGRIDPTPILEMARNGLLAVWQSGGERPGELADVRRIVLEDYEILRPAEMNDAGNVTLTIDMSQRFLDVLMTAGRLQLSTRAGAAPPETGTEGADQASPKPGAPLGEPTGESPPPPSEADAITPGFNLITMTLDRDKIAGMVRSCR